MIDLSEFNRKLIYDLHELREAKSVDQPTEEKEDEDGGSLGIRRVNSKEALGKATKDFDWQIDFDVLRKAICKDVVTVDLTRTKKLFKLFKDYINDQEKFEEKYK